MIIPGPDPYLNETIKKLKETLVYLETRVCRENMKEETRRAEVKRVTELFRNALMQKHTMGDPLYG